MSEQAEVMQAFLHSPSHAVQIREEYGLKDEAEEIFAALLALAED